MNFNGKMVFLFWLFFWKRHRINIYARKYRNAPENYTLQQRNDFLLKKSKTLIKMFNINLKVEGYDNLPKGPCILTPNHKNNMDAILILRALAKQTTDKDVMNKIPTFFAKKELTKRKTIRNTLKLLDTFFVDRKNPRQAFNVLNDFGTFVKENHTYGVIFPEGHRIKDDGLGKFNGGAFKLAISKYIPVVPVAISDTREADKKNRSKKLEVTIKFLPMLSPNALIAKNPVSVAEQVKKMIEGALNEE